MIPPVSFKLMDHPTFERSMVGYLSLQAKQQRLLLRLFFLACAVFIWVNSVKSYAQSKPLKTITLVMASDQYCPFTCEPGSSQEGYLVDLAKQILEPEGYVIHYRVMPWNRVLSYVATGSVDGVLGITESKAKNMILSPPMGVDNEGFMTTNTQFSKPLTETTLHQLDGLRIAHVDVKSFNLELPFQRYLDNRLKYDKDFLVNLTGENSIPQMVKMLLAGRVDVVVESAQVMAYIAKSMGKLSAVRIHEGFHGLNLHIAFKANEDGRRAVHILERELPLWRTSGRLDKLLDSYGLVDWQSLSE